MKTILVAEDYIPFQHLISFDLKKHGFNVFTVDDGKACLEKLQKIEVDLLITDMSMPYVTGLEVISTIRNDWKKQFPIIVISSAGQEKTVEEAFELGADDYMLKPFSLVELFIRVNKLLLLRR